MLVRENRHGAKAALYMKQNMEASLAAMQVAVTLLAAIAAAIGGAGAAEISNRSCTATRALARGGDGLGVCHGRASR